MVLFRSLLSVCACSTLLACASATPAPACAEPSVAAASPRSDLAQLDSNQLAKRLVEVTMGKNLAVQIMDSMLAAFKKIPNLPAGFIERFRDNARAEDLEALVIPIYVKTYERETMIAAIEFYESEQGRIMVTKMPEAVRLGTEAGQKWGKQVADKTLREMGLTPPAN
jgi:uncharacterized protein